MSRIEGVFEHLHKQGRTALIPFITAGDPDPKHTVPLMHAMVEAGADIIELGVPFSDPMADGPVIQRASERALVHGVSLSDCMQMVRRFRTQDKHTPVVLMGYLNPIEVMGYEPFAEQAQTAGVDGVLIVDAPPEEGGDLLTAIRRHNVDPIYLLAPTSTSDRIRRICETASGFVYYVSVKGVTGSASLDTDEVATKLDMIRRQTHLPLGVGFGIKDAATAAAVAKSANAVVVGSAIVSRVENNLDNPAAISPEISAFLKELRQAMDKVKKI